MDHAVELCVAAQLLVREAKRVSLVWSCSSHLVTAQRVRLPLHFCTTSPTLQIRACTCPTFCKMAMEPETEAERLTATYRSLEDTMETDTLVALREPVLQSVDVPRSPELRSGTMERLRRNRVYGALAATSDATPQYVKADATEDLIA